MPELPEVETVRRTLEKHILGLKITTVRVITPKIIRVPDADEFAILIKDRTVREMGRRGKYLLIHLSDGFSLIIHLRMTGQLIYCDPQRETAKHTHLVFNLNNGMELRYVDIRQFGRIAMVPTGEVNDFPGLTTLGPEPLEEDFSREFLKKEVRNRRTKIKPLLLDQTFLAGLGNIYVDEALHQARIHPERLAATLTAREITLLHQAIKDVLKSGIEHRGTSIKDYVDAEGMSGGNQSRLQAYGRFAKPCLQCGMAIERKKVGGRSSYYCPRCQKSK